MEKIFKIYKYTNPENNKVYIGLTKNDPKTRAHTNMGNGYKSCVHFYKAIQKHNGLNFFQLEILKDNLTEEEANYWEDYYIKFYDAKNPNKGYNINDGGGAMSLEQRDKITEINLKNWKSGLYDSLKIPVYCIELNMTFESLTEACEQLKKYGITRRALSDTCKGKHRYCGQKNGKALHWCYLKDKTDKLINELKNRPEKGLILPVYCCELNKIFASASEANRETGVDTTQITKAAKGINKSAGKHPITKEKLHWIYTCSEEFQNKYKEKSDLD